jgi:hypothetical protein
MLNKIRSALAPQGVFVGSESLGKEGNDHLQHFSTLAEIRELFLPYFHHIHLHQVTYRTKSGVIRTEAFWRCSDSADRLEACCWESQVRQEA